MFLQQKLKYIINSCFLAGILLLDVSVAQAQKAPKQAKPLPPVAEGEGGRLVYAPDANGDRIPDFSYCGYRASEQAIPNVPIRVVVPVKKGDATLRIQSAIDYVASLPADEDGIRGAVLLEKGKYDVLGSLLIRNSGVVLRGSGNTLEGTIIVGGGKDRETLIRILGKKDKKLEGQVKITNAYLPVNSTEIKVADAAKFKAGDMVIITHPTTQAWIEKLGMVTFGGGISSLGWKPGDREIYWDRKILAVKGDVLTLDVPLTTALDSAFGGGTVTAYHWPGRISQVGVENLQLRSYYDEANPKDEAHRWMAITVENTSDAWVRQVVFKHFASSAVNVLESSHRVTVEDCKSLSPTSEIGGQRRYSFTTTGQQTLFQRCYSEFGYHDFSVGICAPGPNAFVQCNSWQSVSFSGAIDSWASGVLFDVVNIDANRLSYANRGQDGQGAGWSAANSLFWNCTAAIVDCPKPPTAQNWAFGTWAQFQGDGYWSDSNNSISPRSFYYAQLSDRIGKDRALALGQIFPLNTSASSSPTVKEAEELIARYKKPQLHLTDWIDQVATRNPIPVNGAGVKTIDQIGVKQPEAPKQAAPMQLVNGWIVRGNAVLTGKHYDSPWWMGNTRPEFIKTAKPSVTRYVPGRTGTGLTDDLDSMTNKMVNQHVLTYEHNYGLWYDRRRDDHERIRRMDGEVWPPFYELPFARSGQSSGWDGLSKYDLTKYNTWYWGRLKKFADLADEKGLVLIHQNYFQHNIIEAGAHYVDFPWRTANNINNTSFPEPVPFAGDKRIFMAEQFYDEKDPAQTKLHTAFIRQCLDNFKDNSGVIQLLAEEFTGPLHFVQFWVDNIKTWEADNNKKEIIGLSTTKDVQDALLADAARAAVINVIDVKYWHYQADGTTYQPAGGQSLAPRQHARLLKPKPASFEQVYRAVNEYRIKYPDKAVIYSADGYEAYGWAVFMGGGSLANIPVIANPQFNIDASSMKSIDMGAKGQYALGNPEKGYIVYSTSDNIHLNLSNAKGSFVVRWINPRDGRVIKQDGSISGGKEVDLKTVQNGPVILWASRK
ncbi:DUF6298 domain-containing protein [Mucilaginibacter paludis]|uniref:DUF6298 domain-containing protein n=1 Tax=Mucilaginibacter paludis DSM 18603 TaxID=714943 RepID=H1YEP7_9SPHI|nr:DUF6298 domain-containing protein [Mucilaginibacter paludis]EHQ30807.1 hypothetical protein Mucpa_6758 [Mucilaginibacter paludis DSM 18603]